MRDPAQISTRAQFASGLTALRTDADLTVRQLAKQVDAPASTLGAYFSGRHVPPAAATPLVRAILLTLGVDEDDVGAWLSALRRARGSADRRGPSEPNQDHSTKGPAPYRGLASFEPDDAALFFGRDRPTREILDRIAGLALEPGPSHGVLAVIGPSGAGKSSVLRAGVIAAIRRGELGEADDAWTCSISTPSAPVDTHPPGSAGPPGRSVLVIDQFEEIFTSVGAERRAELLRAVADHPRDQIVVLGMRADFYADAARVPELLAALQHAQVLLGPMTTDELRDAICRPAERSGVDIEDSLVELVLSDLAPRAGHELGAHDIGTLPLMSHALLAAWDRSDGRQLRVEDYRATGGIDGAVQQTAEDAYTGLPADQRQTARSVFLRLVNVDGDVLTTRRRIDAAELHTLGTQDRAVQLVARFVEHRLVTAGESWYEISHEALLSAWPRLRAWVDEDRAGLVTHRRLTEAASAWVRAGRAPGALLHGSALDVTEAWADDHAVELNDAERDLVTASVASRTAGVRAERRRLQRLRALLAASVVLVVLAVVLSLVLVQARDRADRSRAQERSVRNAALSRAVAFEASQLYADNPALSQQLALAAYRAAPTTEARGELTDESAQPTVTRVLGQTGPTALAGSPRRHLLAVSRAVDGAVQLYSLAHGPVPRPEGVLPGVTGRQIFAMAFSASGTMLAVGGESGTVRLWDVADPLHPNLSATVHPGFNGAIEALAISPDGHTLVAGSLGAVPVRRWNITDPARPVGLTPLPGLIPHTTTQAIAFDRSGRLLAASDTTGTVQVWTVSGRRVPAPRVLSTGSSGVPSLVFDPVRPLLITGDGLGVVDVWSTAQQKGAQKSMTPKSMTQPLHVLAGKSASQVNALAISADGSVLAAGSSDSDLREWSTSDWTVQADTGNPGPVTGVDFVSDDRVATTAADGALRLQRTGTRQLSTTGSTFALVWSADGRRLLVATNGTHGGEQLWNMADPGDPTRLGPLLTMPEPYDPVAGSGAMRANGTLVAGGDDQGRVELWDTADPSHPVRTTAPFDADDGHLVESLVFTPNGRTLAVGGDDGGVHLWDVAGPAHPREVATIDEGDLVLQLAVSPNSRELAAANADDSAYLYRITDPAHPVRLARITGPHNYVWGVGFSPDGRTLATADADDTTRLYDIARPTRPHRLGRPLIGPSDYDYSAAFTPNGRGLAVASNDGTVRTYAADGSDRVPLETLRAANSPEFVTAYNPSGTVLAAGGRTDGVTLWSTRAAPYAQRLCRVAGTPITRAEWALYVPDEPYDPPCR